MKILKPIYYTLLLVAAGSFFSCLQEEIANQPITNRAAASWSHTGGECAGDDLTVCFDNGQGSNCGDTHIQVWDGTDWIQVAHTTPTNGVLCYTVTAAEAGEHRFRAMWVRNGNPALCPGTSTGWIEYSVDVVECCSNALTAVASCDEDEECNRSVTFTFTALESGPIVIQGGLTAFTTICSATASEGLTLNPTHPSAGGPSNVTRWEGNVNECEQYTVTINWTSTNDDAEITGEWTAKRNGVTLASVAPLTCPQ